MDRICGNQLFTGLVRKQHERAIIKYIRQPICKMLSFSVSVNCHQGKSVCVAFVDSAQQKAIRRIGIGSVVHQQSAGF